MASSTRDRFTRPSRNKLESTLYRTQLLNSKRYQDVKVKVEKLLQKVKSSNKKNLDKNLKMATDFFAKLKKEEPVLYSIFKIHEKTLGESARLVNYKT